MSYGIVTWNDRLHIYMVVTDIPAHSLFITFNHARHAAGIDNATLLNTQAKQITET